VEEKAARLLADGVLARVPELADELVRVIAEQNPGYRRINVVSRDDLRKSCQDNMTSVLRLIGRDGAEEEQLYSAARCTGRRRAEQRMPLDDVLRSFRLGGRLLWQALVEQARADGTVDAEGLLEIATWLWEVVDSTSAQVAAAYHVAEQQLVRIDEQRRATLWEGLLRGRGKDLAFAYEAARIIGVPVDGPYAAVVADVEDVNAPAFLNRLLAEHVFLASSATGGALGNRDAQFKAAAAELDGNSVDLSKAIGSAYGPDAAAEIAPHLPA